MRVSTIATLAVLAAPAAAGAQCPDGRPPESCARPLRAAPPPANVRARQIVLLPFRNVTRTPANDWLVAGAPLLLGEILGQYRDLDVVPEARLTAARRRLGISSDSVPDEAQRRGIAEETGGWTSVTGNILLLGNTLRVSADAFDAATGSIVARATAEVPAGSDIRPVFDRLAVQLLQPAGVTQVGSPRDVVALTTRSIDAYRSYTEGIAFMQRGAYQRAEAAFREAVRKDTSFAMAWVKLGTVAIQSRGLPDILNPFGLMAQAVERAGRASASLPPRTSAGIQGIQALFHGEVARARRVADSLIATDPEDIDAHQWLAMVHFFDSRMDSVTGLRLGSLTQSVEESKWVLRHDPGRQEMYVIPAIIYGYSAGFFGGIIGTRKRPMPSLAAELMTPPEVAYRATVRDTIVPVLDSVWKSWSPAERAAANTRAADAGRIWVERWMAANPNDAEAHLWASRFEEIGGDYAKSLAEYDRAVALGAETVLENLRARRLYLFEMTGRFAAAEALADSVIAAGGLRTKPVDHWIDRSRIIVPAVLLRSKQWARAISVARTIDSTDSPCFALIGSMSGWDVKIPPQQLRAIADTAANHFTQIWTGPGGRCAADWSLGFGDTSRAPRAEAVRRLLTAADSLHAARDPGALLAAATAGSIDTTRRAAIRATPWVDSLARIIEVTSRFDEPRVVVDGDSMVVATRYVGDGPMLVRTPRGMRSHNFSFRTTPAGADSARVSFFIGTRADFADTATYGTVTDLVARLGKPQAFYTTATRSTPIPVVVTAAGNELRVTIRGGAIASLKALRPTTARLSGVCTYASGGLCSTRTFPIEYR